MAGANPRTQSRVQQPAYNVTELVLITPNLWGQRGGQKQASHHGTC